MTEQDLSVNAQRLYRRYIKNYVTDEQLERYYKINYITLEEYKFIKKTEKENIF